MNKEDKGLFGLSLGHFMLDGYVAILIPLYPYIAQRLNINLATISLIIALGHGISSFLQPVFGYLSDNISKRFFMFWGLMFASIFMPLGYIAPNAAILTLCLLMGMLGNALYHPQVTKMIKNFYKENQKLSFAIGLFLALGTISYAISPAISSFLAQTLKENYVYISIFGIIISFFMLFFVPKIQNDNTKTSIIFLEAIKEILSDKVCVFLIIITVIKAALMMSFGTYIPFLLKKFNFSMQISSYLITLFFISGGISMIIAPKLEKYFKLKGMIALSYIPLLPLTLAFLWFLNSNKYICAIILIIIGFFVLLAAGVVLTHAQKTTTKYVGIISGIIQGLTLSIGSLLLIPFGILGQNFGVETVLITITSIALIASIYALKSKLLNN